jgi:hypothetical protein
MKIPKGHKQNCACCVCSKQRKNNPDNDTSKLFNEALITISNSETCLVSWQSNTEHHSRMLWRIPVAWMISSPVLTWIALLASDISGAFTTFVIVTLVFTVFMLNTIFKRRDARNYIDVCNTNIEKASETVMELEPHIAAEQMAKKLAAYTKGAKA